MYLMYLTDWVPELLSAFKAEVFTDFVRFTDSGKELTQSCFFHMNINDNKCY